MSTEELEQRIEEIYKNYSVLNGKVYVLSIVGSEELLATYNIQSPVKLLLSSTFVANRKKDYNTVYTLNALNEEIKAENNGVLDKTYKLDWSKYRNMVLLTSGGGNGVRKLETRIFRIFTK
jgi:uncharacterized protein YfkK (UPF0435 family)